MQRFDPEGICDAVVDPVDAGELVVPYSIVNEERVP
jgi:hypothetical protein